MKHINDLIIYNGIAGVASIHFLLKTYGTQMFASTLVYVLMWLVGSFLLLTLRIYGGPSGEAGDLTDYDEDLESRDAYLVLGSVVIIVIVSSCLVAGFTESALFVPRPNQTLSLGTFPVGVLEDIIYNFTLVALAEETIKIAFILILYRKWHSKWLAVVCVVGMWSVWHLYLSYIGAIAPILAMSAFIAGIVLFLQLQYTESLENAVISHGLYNSLIVLASAMA